MPKVSIVMNCFNSDRYLEVAIDSIYAQSFQDWEIIFWDNASVDESYNITKKYDNKLKYFRGLKTIPLGAARKCAVEKARGEWVAFLDCDDIWEPEKLAVQLKALEGSEYIICYAGVTEINPDGSEIRDVLPEYPSGWMLEQQLLQFDINMVTPLVRRQALLENGLNFDVNITASEEYNLFVRLAAKGAICAIPKILGKYRVSQNSLTNAQMSKWAFERRYTLEQLKKENPNIDKNYQRAFVEAYARGDYYEARHHMLEGSYAHARAVLRSIRHLGLQYRLLWVVSYIPLLWQLIHSNFVKRKFYSNLRKLAIGNK